MGHCCLISAHLVCHGHSPEPDGFRVSPTSPSGWEFVGCKSAANRPQRSIWGFAALREHRFFAHGLAMRLQIRQKRSSLGPMGVKPAGFADRRSKSDGRLAACWVSSAWPSGPEVQASARGSMFQRFKNGCCHRGWRGEAPSVWGAAGPSLQPARFGLGHCCWHCRRSSHAPQ